MPTVNKSDRKYRFAAGLCVTAAICHFINILKYRELIVCLTVALFISYMMIVTVTKYNLIRMNYAKGIGGVAVAVSAIMWKKIHATSIMLEALIALTLCIFFLILTFKYSANELEGRQSSDGAEN